MNSNASPSRWLLRAGFAFLGLAGSLIFSQPARADFKADAAAKMKNQLAGQVLPYWFETTLDTRNGGYLLADDLKGRGTATEKQLVSQARMVWGFSHAHLKGYSDAQHDYLKAAASGYQFLFDHFRDPLYGGYFWKTDLAGNVTKDCKFLYGESFVVYALVEYHRASHDPLPLKHAVELYRTLQLKLHDATNGGWIEHADRDWRPFPLDDPRSEVEIAGLKSANSHLHWMEALTELYDATHDAAVKKSLEEALRLNATMFYPREVARCAFHRRPDWKPVTEARSAGLSYGHNVEFAWLMIRAETVLGRKPSWDHFDALMQHTLDYGFDHRLGGIYNRGFDDRPATDTDKVWWSQAEMLAALTDGLKHQSNPPYSKALDQLLRFLTQYQINAADGIWLDTVAADGTPKNTGKAHNWKANYHDVRGMVKFIDAFAPPAK